MIALRWGATYLRTLPHVTKHASIVMQFSSLDVQHARINNPWRRFWFSENKQLMKYKYSFQG